jgi:serine/threonine-protein kinase
VPGQIIAGRYRIERFLAQGGYGSVYVAEQLATEALVALKVLSPNVLTSQEAVERFELEARVAGRVRSDFIVRVIDAGVDESTRMPFLAMELLEGESLLEHVQRVGPLGVADTATFMMQVAQGLDKAHGYVTKEGKAAPIVHRDLKPENLFLTMREDGLPVIKILDFGIAKVLGEDVAMSRGIKGTPLYMAHEQLQGEALSLQTDIWAFGLIAFFLLTGRSYWLSASSEHASLATVIAEVISSTIEPPSERLQKMGVEARWGAAFDAWFMRCVNRDVRARFTSAGEAANALATVLLGPGWSATLPPGLLSQPSSSEPARVPFAPSASVSGSMVTAAQPSRSLAVPRTMTAASVVLVTAGFAYVALHREPARVPAPKSPVGGTDAHAAPAVPSAWAANPLPSAVPTPSTAAPPTPVSSAAPVASGQSSPPSKKRVGGQHIKAADGTAPSASAVANPGVVASPKSDRIYNER